MHLPNDVEFILEKFNTNGYLAYVVGGCVRDALLSKTPTDWDICTDALPEETIDIFKSFKIIKTGIKHGTVTLLLNSVPYEITTFRTDGDYSDNRHPQSVNFVRNIDEDLKRRDFTINAIAYNPKEKIVDLYGGREDLKNKKIRCVGNSEKRFSEDALRIMRAIRFSALLGFDIEEETKKAIFLLKDNLNDISRERINTEFSKILLSDSVCVYSEFANVFSLFLKNTDYLDTYFAKTLTSLPYDLSIRLAYLMIYLNYDELNAAKFMRELRYSLTVIKKVSEIIKNFDIIKYNNIKDLRHSLSVSDEFTVLSILKIKNIPSAISMLEEIKNKNLCYKTGDLKISGNDLISLGISDGIIIGKILKNLLHLVIEEKTENKKETLLALAKTIMEEIK